MQERVLKKYIVRGSVILGLIIIYIIGNSIIFNLNKEFGTGSPRIIQFSFPLPADIAAKYGIRCSTPIKDIDRIVITGFFSDWDIQNNHYAMERVGENLWQIKMYLDPGLTQYKFVIHTSNDYYDSDASTNVRMIWTQDKNAKKQINDNYGGVNSGIETVDFNLLQNIFAIVIWSLLGVVVAYSVLEALIYFLLHIRMSFKIKLVIVVVFIGLLGNIAFIAYNRAQFDGFIRQGFTDEFNIIHNVLIKNGLNPEKIDDVQNRTKVQDNFQKILDSSVVRNEKNRHSNIQTMIAQMWLLDKNLNVVAYAISGINAYSDILINLKRLNISGVNVSETFLMQIAQTPSSNEYRSLLSRYSQNDPRYQSLVESYDYIPDKAMFRYNRMAFLLSNRINLQSVFTNYPLTFQMSLKDLIKKYDSEGKLINQSTPILNIDPKGGYMIYPIIHKHMIVGYYLAELRTQIYKDELARIEWFNLYLIFLVGLILTMILSKVGVYITHYLTLLKEWTQSIVEGNFEDVKKIDTRDEIEALANNFNRMRLSLGSNLRNLKLLNMITTYLQKLTSIDAIYSMFLTFVTANFGFGYNRAGIFLMENAHLVGKIAIGMLNEKEVIERFGSIEEYKNLKLEVEPYLNDFQKQLPNLENDFSRAISEITISQEEKSVFVDVIRSEKTLTIRGEKNLPYDIDKHIARKLNLQDFILLPIFKGNSVIGVMFVDNFISKNPISEENINQLQILLNEFAVILQNAYLVENLEKIIDERNLELVTERNELKVKNEAIEAQLDLARKIQMKLVPSSVPDKRIAFFYKPMEKVGGDFFDFIKLPSPDKIGLFISDVSGHGVPAALITSMLKGAILQRDDLLEDPASLLMNLNEFLISQSGGNFVTALYGIYNFSDRTFSYANAGHNPRT